MRAHVFLFTVLSLIACKHDKAAELASAPKAPVSTSDQDALWALAPDQVIVGAVISPRGLAHVEQAAQELEKILQAAPDLAPIKLKIDEALQEVLGTTNPSLAAAGLSSTKGAALFMVPGETPIMILPVVDRDKFLAVVHGTKGADSDTVNRATCKMVNGVYACAKNLALFARLGKGSLAAQLELSGARGDLEVAAKIPSSDKDTITFGVVAQLGRGTVVIRGGVKGLPPDAKLMIANARPRVDGDRTAGFAVINPMPLVGMVGAKVPAQEIAPGVALDALVRSFAGPLTVSIANGATSFDLRIPLSDEGPAKSLLAECNTLPPMQMLGATVKDGVCHVPLPQMMMELDVWVDGKVLRVGKKDGPPATGASAPLSAVGQELATGEWALAMFGRGSVFGPVPIPVPPGTLPPEAMMAMRGLALVNELGVGVRLDGDVLRVLGTVRTAWSNPDEVVAKLIKISPAALFDGTASNEAKAIAAASPGSPFAGDHAAGYGGLMMPAFGIGVLAAVAIPAFLEYTKKAKQSEASLELRKLGKTLKAVLVAKGELPKGEVGPTPAKSCCAQGGKCAVDAAAWKDPIWQALDFEIDEPHLYRYSYRSADGKSYVVKAIGDLDCDGTEAEYTMSGEVDAQGNLTSTVVPPAAGAD